MKFTLAFFLFLNKFRRAIHKNHHIEKINSKEEKRFLKKFKVRDGTDR